MIIGVDGNEASVQNRVGSGQYTYELLRQFARISTKYSSSDPEFIEGESRRHVILERLVHRSFSVGGSDRIPKSSRQVYTEFTLRVHPEERMRSVYTEFRRSARTLNHQFIVYLKGQPLADLPKENENFKYKIFGPKKFWTQFALPINLTFDKKPDVFFSPAHYGPRFSRVPYVVTIHDLSYLHFPELFKKNDLYQLTNWSKYSIKGSKHIIVPSNSTKEDIVKNYQINPSKITVTYEGYNRSRFKPQPKSTIEKIKAKYKIKGDYIIFVGTLQPRKNLERLIEAFAKIIFNFQFSTLNLVIVGKKGWLYDSIFQKVKDLKIETNVIFTDFVPDKDLPALISGAKVYVNPSLWEGFGIPVIEAQACGVPVVVSNSSSLPEIVNPTSVIPAKAGIQKKILDPFEKSQGKQVENDNQASGILVDPESVESITSGIQKVLTDEKTRSDLVKKGFENIKRFSWQSCAAETIKILESAVK